jgi:hypothetical protein
VPSTPLDPMLVLLKVIRPVEGCHSPPPKET